MSSSWQWESLQSVAAAFAEQHPDVEVLVERSRDPAGRMEALRRTRGVRCFLSGTSEGHVRKILPWVRSHPEVVVCSPTSTALPGSFEGGLLPRNFVRVMPHDGNMPNVIGKCVVNEVRARLRASRERREAAKPRTVPQPAPETRHPSKPQLERIAAAGLLVDPTEQPRRPRSPRTPSGPCTPPWCSTRTRPTAGARRGAPRAAPGDEPGGGRALRADRLGPEATVRLLDAMAGPERVAVVVYLGFGADFNGYVRACRSAPGCRR